MIRFFVKTLFLISLTLSWANANEAIKSPSRADASQDTGRELGRIFRAAAGKVESPKPAPKPKPSLSDEIPSGGRALTVSAYSYCLTGRTASGRYTAPGIIAVDPRVIPLGSKMYVPGYGWGVAADTGGAIVGQKIDVWLPTLSQCYQWGVRRVDIKVFPPGS